MEFQRIRQLITHAKTVQFGGAADTAAFTAAGAGALLSSPFFDSPPAISLGCGMAAGLWLGHRLLAPAKNSAILTTKLNIRSSPSPSSEGLLIGYTTDTGKPVHIPDEDLMRHALIIGQSGVGKTVAGSLLMAQQIQRGGGVLFVDGKMNNDDLEHMWRLCKWAGRERDLLVINPGNPDKSNTYNPILYGDPDEVAARCLALIPGTESSPGADHYRQMANQGITTIVGALQRAGLAYTFIDLTILLMNAKAIEELEEKVRAVAPHAEETMALAHFIEQFRVAGRNGEINIDMKRLRETFGGIAGRLFQFGTGLFGKVMNTYDPEVKLFDAVRDGKIVYVLLPTMGKNDAANNFGKMVVSDLRTAVAWMQSAPKKERPWPPYLCFFDEAGSYINNAWSRLFEQSRSANIALLPAAQTLANFQAISDELAEMIQGNTWSKIFFKLGTQATAEAAADLIGKEMRAMRSLTHNESASSSGQKLGTVFEGSSSDGKGGGYSEREQEMHRVSPDELKWLDKGECVMTYGGDSLYNLRVPLVEFDQATIAELGTFTLNRQRQNFVRGADFFKNSDRYLSV